MGAVRDKHFNPEEQRHPAPITGPIQTYDEEIVGFIHESFDKWTNHIEPQLFTARLVLRGTPLYEPMAQVNRAPTRSSRMESALSPDQSSRPAARDRAANEDVACPFGSA